MHRSTWVVVFGLWSAPGLAQTPEAALSNAWTAACAGAAPGSQLALRCTEIFAGGPGSRDIAAAGNFLDEIPGQGRSSTREGGSREHEQRQSIAATVSLFASADTGRLQRKQGSNEAGFDGNTGSVTVGLDWAPHPEWLLGAALSHSEETLDFDASDGSARGHYTGLIGYAAWNLADSVALNGYFGRLDGSNALRRAIDYSLPSSVHVQALALASPDSTRTLSGLGLDWTLPKGAWQWQFGAGVDWMKLKLDAYTESGGEGLALSVPDRQIVTRRGRLDATLTRTVSQNWGVWQPQLRIGLRHEFANPGRVLTVSFAGDANDTPIAFNTEDPDSSWGEWALGSVFVFKRGHSGFLQYRQRFGHAFLQERVLALGWRVELH
ncbi:MAG: autotransporter outer membrane beta-barrel domain-containing protein [Arenimonas sp.]